MHEQKSDGPEASPLQPQQPQTAGNKQTQRESPLAIAAATLTPPSLATNRTRPEAGARQQIIQQTRLVRRYRLLQVSADCTRLTGSRRQRRCCCSRGIPSPGGIARAATTAAAVSGPQLRGPAAARGLGAGHRGRTQPSAQRVARNLGLSRQLGDVDAVPAKETASISR